MTHITLSCTLSNVDTEDALNCIIWLVPGLRGTSTNSNGTCVYVYFIFNVVESIIGKKKRYGEGQPQGGDPLGYLSTGQQTL